MPFVVPEGVTDAHVALAMEALPRITRLKGTPSAKLAGVIAAAICVTEQRDDLRQALAFCRDTLKAQMAENWPEEEWPETVFYNAYLSASVSLAKVDAHVRASKG